MMEWLKVLCIGHSMCLLQSNGCPFAVQDHSLVIPCVCSSLMAVHLLCRFTCHLMCLQQSHGCCPSAVQDHLLAIPSACSSLMAVHLLCRDPSGTMIAFDDMMRKQIVMPAHLMNDAQHPQDRNLFKDFSAVAQATKTYTGQVCVPTSLLALQHTLRANLPIQDTIPCCIRDFVLDVGHWRKLLCTAASAWTSFHSAPFR